MKLVVKAILIILVTVSLAGCLKDPTSDQYIKMVQQVKEDNLKLEEKVKTLENQVKALNDELYQNNKRTETLEEVYDYVAKDNEMPGTGEELPADNLD